VSEAWTATANCNSGADLNDPSLPAGLADALQPDAEAGSLRLHVESGTLAQRSLEM
jgi:hypothetical protein